MDGEQTEFTNYLKVIRKRRLMIIGGALVFMAIAWIASQFMPKTYETRLHIVVGRVWEKPIDDPLHVAEAVNSVPFLDQVRQKTGLNVTAYKMKVGKVVQAYAIEGMKRLEKPQPVLVEIVARANNPEKALELVNAAAELLIQSHEPRYDELMREYLGFQMELEKQIQVVQQEVDELDRSIKKLRNDPQVSAPAVILLQAQLEEKQSQIMGFRKELRDVKINNISKVHSENTRVLIRPFLPQEPVSPKTALNVVISGIAGLIGMLLLSFLLESLAQAKRFD